MRRLIPAFYHIPVFRDMVLSPLYLRRPACSNRERRGLTSGHYDAVGPLHQCVFRFLLVRSLLKAASFACRISSRGGC
ncbi:hypothetical protein OUZ56_014647 [Daphnia magna]|uniref:Uncharacterized protein n=1 Tax=Daphnia magna TaxID=35525 RepID=A0ABR0AKD8_9CRUS|nr:hypothetical protein OUZ56_014647 [Daphnia magna]